MSIEATVFLVGLAMAFAIALVLFVLVYPPLRRMFALNSTLQSARSFYARTFFLIMLLAAWTPLLEQGVPQTPATEQKPQAQASPAPSASEPQPQAVPAAAEPTPPAETDEAFMTAVWHVAEGLKSVCLSVSIFLTVYVVVLTVLYATLGRIRDASGA
jgi:predicted PurR-regulated permease PerM